MSNTTDQSSGEAGNLVLQMQQEVINFFTENHEMLKAAKREAISDLTKREGSEAVEAARIAELPIGGALDALVALLESRISEDFTFIDPYGEVVYKQRLIHRLRSGRAIFDNFTYSQQNVHIYGDMAVMTCLVTVNGLLDGADVGGKYFETHTLRKDESGWQLLATQMNLIQPIRSSFVSAN